MAALKLTGVLPVGTITNVINTQESAATRLCVLTIIVPQRLSKRNIQPGYWPWCRCVMPNDERTRLREHIIEISGCSSMERPVSPSESGMSVETDELTLPLVQSGWAEGRADGPDCGLDMHQWKVVNV